jgi:hypothetical protein
MGLGFGACGGHGGVTSSRAEPAAQILALLRIEKRYLQLSSRRFLTAKGWSSQDPVFAKASKTTGFQLEQPLAVIDPAPMFLNTKARILTGLQWGFVQFNKSALSRHKDVPLASQSRK